MQTIVLCQFPELECEPLRHQDPGAFVRRLRSAPPLFARLCLCPVKGTKRLLRDFDMCVDPIAHRIAVCIVTGIDAYRELLWTIFERKGKPVGQLHIKEINRK